MKTYYYYRALRKTIIQFLDLFNDIKIARYQSDGTTISKYVNVPLKFGPKEKIWYWLNERKNDEMLPIMSVIIESIDFDPSRLGNRLYNVTKSTSAEDLTMQRFVNPIPYNVGFTLSLWTLHMADADQILEQILPFFCPDLTMRTSISELDASFDIKVFFRSCSPDINVEMPDEDRRIVKWNLSFEVRTYLFKPIEEVGIIKKIIQKIYTSEDTWAYRGLYTDGSTETLFTSGASGAEAESMFIKATPSGGEYYNSDGDPYYEYEIFGND